MKTPDNLEVFASHGSDSYPDSLKPLIRTKFNERLIQNFSDWGTSELISDIPANQRLIPKHGRIAGDTNRSLNASDLFRETDFGGIQIFNKMPDETLKKKLLEESYIPYHREAFSRLMAAHGNPNNSLLVVDIHDTGNLLLGETPDQDKYRLVAKGYNMPPLILSSQDGKTASQAVVDNLVSAFENHFKLASGDIRINDYYKGGYFTQRYGLPDTEIAEELRNAKNPQRDVVQIELGRYLYMEEKTQMLNPNAIRHFREKLAIVLNEVSDGLRK
ncbi:N-formylglutamate amidohydrolase [Candidatus Peregrinibacteria bacterium]|nr:N-formylglutamate amidohydrolase [Candidatus Peregrinibacteria bacterium]